MRQKWWILLLSLFCVFPVWADTPLEPLLNTVTVTLTAEEWVTSKTALVSIGINASVNDRDLGNMQNHLLETLKQLSNNADWHIVSFNRSLDQSGLEKIQAVGQARLPSNALGSLRDKTKSISKPGETFTLDNVQFIPSEIELRDATNTLRNNIYQQAKAEIDQLDKLYPDQKYYLHQIDFLNEMTPVQNTLFIKTGMSTMANANLAVGNKLKMVATVVLASAPNQDVVKMIHN